MDYPAMASFRMTRDDLDLLEASAAAAGMDRSQYLRTLVRLQGSARAGETAYVIDASAMAAMAKELVRWGRHYNQAVRALNTLALFVRRGTVPDAETFGRLLDEAARGIGEVEQGRAAVESALAAVAASVKVLR